MSRTPPFADPTHMLCAAYNRWKDEAEGLRRKIEKMTDRGEGSEGEILALTERREDAITYMRVIVQESERGGPIG